MDADGIQGKPNAIIARAPRRSAHLEALNRIRERSAFDKTKFRCFIKKIAQNPKGHVDITLTVPYEDRAQALELMNSYGMPLELQIIQWGWSEEEDRSQTGVYLDAREQDSFNA